MTWTVLCVNKPVTVPVIFEPPCIFNKMQRYTDYLFLETTVHVSGGTSTHHQEHTQLSGKESELPQLFHDSGK